MIVLLISLALLSISLVYAGMHHQLTTTVHDVLQRIPGMLHTMLTIGVVIIIGSICMAILSDSHCLTALAKVLRKPLRFCFPKNQCDDKTLGEISLNASANVFGVGNAATPAGIQAMHSLQKHNPNRKHASHAMCMLLAINTSSIQLLPYTPIALLLAAGDPNAWVIWPLTLVVTSLNTALAIGFAKLAQRISVKRGAAC